MKLDGLEKITFQTRRNFNKEEVLRHTELET
jgi:hypothetical protein